jgi:hypothetical protein
MNPDSFFREVLESHEFRLSDRAYSFMSDKANLSDMARPGKRRRLGQFFVDISAASNYPLGMKLISLSTNYGPAGSRWLGNQLSVLGTSEGNVEMISSTVITSENCLPISNKVIA